MAFDFPSSPTTGQTYSVTGGPTYVYNGTAWVVLTPGNQFNRTVFTATAGQTTFSMNYVVGAIDVYRNGVKLAPADFTATNGTSIVLLNAATVGDTIEVISYPMITYSDAVKRTGDTMTGNLDIAAQLKVSGAMTTISPTTKGIYAGFDPSAPNNIGIDVVTATNGIAWLDFHDGAGTDFKGRIAYANSSNQLAIYSGGNLGINIDSVGRITIPNQPVFTAYKDNGGAYATVGTVVFNNLFLNRGNNYNNTTGKFTAPVAGVYAFGFYAHTETVNANARVVTFRKNGGVSITLYTLPNNNREQVGKQIFIQMAANDTMEIYNDTGESWWAGDSSGMMFTGYLLG